MFANFSIPIVLAHSFLKPIMCIFTVGVFTGVVISIPIVFLFIRSRRKKLEQG